MPIKPFRMMSENEKTAFKNDFEADKEFNWVPNEALELAIAIDVANIAKVYIHDYMLYRSKVTEVGILREVVELSANERVDLDEQATAKKLAAELRRIDEIRNALKLRE